MSNPPDTNQASEDDLATNIDKIIEYWDFSPLQDEDSRIERVHKEIESLIRTEKLKLLDEVVHQSTANLKSARAVAGWAELRKKQLEAEL